MGNNTHSTNQNKNRGGKYLTFTLCEEEYGLEILKLKEIIGITTITSVPQTPAFVKGVINLRGKVMPVVDLRLRFGMEAAPYTKRTCIIIVEITAESGRIAIGIVVDAVSEVIHIKAEDIEAAPEFGGSLNTRYILGMAKIEESVKILLDIDNVLSREDTAILEKAA